MFKAEITLVSKFIFFLPTQHYYKMKEVFAKLIVGLSLVCIVRKL